LDLTPGGHDMGAWHAEIPPMIAWMTTGLAGTVSNLARLAAVKTEHARQERLHGQVKTAGPASRRAVRPARRH
jgi:hypothetical protein